MEYIMNAICSFIERNLTVGRIITNFIPVGLSAQSLSPAIIFLLTVFLIKFMPVKFGFTYGNKNNNSWGGTILKSPTYATVLRVIHIFCCIYMVLWNVYLLIRPISS